MGMTDKMGTMHRAPTLGKINDKKKMGLMNQALTQRERKRREKKGLTLI